ncbi:hypothetical protein P152DRAFT_448758 [Eremomyces bilateralis CBS 781.70]|uniref:Uncharacterized protein n=1 Tax=Eremomyces bilateralis CBS 781.70 TaxID=1392243 RepID=A0A6G1G5W6_9PEZI|nr:uncharacterized protein P152DRAFT_448758 [Eremomyces bilateralis CBS 781.70]KAF1813457.1 hypothetical protein P152DRAFT_448758 [Eremomyces bilateralis CBS 781.70]
MKHYHGKRYEYAVRQGITAYTKLEFLDGIGEVRQQALTEGTIRSGFRKAGIHPWDPEMVLKKIRPPPREAEQRPLTPPEQGIQEGQHASPGLKTPTTVRATRRLGSFIQEDESIPIHLRPRIDQLCRGAQTQSLEAKKAMQDLYGSDLAKKMRLLNAREGNKRRVFSGGMITVDQCRTIVDNREQERIDKAARKEAKKKETARKKAEKAKEARKKARKDRDSLTASASIS